MNPFELYKALYNKTKPNVEHIESGINICINQWLSLIPSQVPNAKELVDHFFYISPRNYYYLLYFGVRGSFAFKKKPTALDMNEDLLLRKVQYILGWTDREIQLSSAVLKETILKDKDKWMELLAVQE